MADLNLPEGIPIPGWFRRYLEARANDAGPADIPPPPPPPVVAVPLPPPGTTFAKICKDFIGMGGKSFLGTETFAEARNWLKEAEDLFVIFDMEDHRKVQLAAWLLKEEAAF